MAATETLPDIPVSFASDLGSDYRFNRSQFGDGYSQTSADGINTKIMNWQVQWNAVTTTQAQALSTFFDARGGGMEPFLWTDPLTETEYQWALVGTLKRVPIGFDTENVSGQFTQVFDL